MACCVKLSAGQVHESTVALALTKAVPKGCTLVGDKAYDVDALREHWKDRSQPMLPMRAGKPRMWSNEYVRHGTQTMLAAVDIATGKATTWVNNTRKSAGFVTFMVRWCANIPASGCMW